MSWIVYLDSGPLGLASNPRGRPEAVRCSAWLEGLLTAGAEVVVPEVAEARRLVHLPKRRAVPHDPVHRTSDVTSFSCQVPGRSVGRGRRSKGAAMIEGDAIRGIARSTELYRRGVSCPAILWFQVTHRLTADNARRLLGELPAELQDVLRGAYQERPRSLRSDFEDSDVRRAVERWCRSIDG